MEEHRKDIIEKAKLIVIKVGTNVLTDKDGRFDDRTVSHLAEEVARLKGKGLSIIMVSSGAIGAGTSDICLSLGKEFVPRTLPELQAAAAVGQSSLMRMYNEEFVKHELRSAQILLSREDFEDRLRYLNVRNTLMTLLKLPAIPVINENDSVSTDEIKFGDNDILSAMVASLVGADVLVILSTVDGLLALGAGKGGESRLIDYVESVSDGIMTHVTDEKSPLGTGGMESKLRAAEMAMKAGVGVVIANGRKSNTLARIFSGEKIGTFFLPGARRIASRKKWIGFSKKVKGQIRVDAGAASALKEKGKSLLSSGITAVMGEFSEGDMVAICDEKGVEFARGLSNYASEEIDKIKGKRTDKIASILGTKIYDEVVHRDNMILI